MNTDKKTDVIRLLRTYHDRERQMALLRYELEHPVRVTSDDMIESMTFAHGEHLGKSGGVDVDKTARIALEYQKRVDSTNAENVHVIAVKLDKLVQTQERLKFYVSLLNSRERDVIQLIYFEGRSAEEVAYELSVAVRTVHKIRGRAVEQLAEMYGFTEVVDS